MGSTISATAQTFKQSVQYILNATDENEVWRYPRLDLQQEGRQLAADIETVLEVIHVRVSRVRDQAVRICMHLDEMLWHIWGVTYRLWRIVYHLIQLMDEVGGEVAEMSLRVPRVLLELAERGRERGMAEQLGEEA